MNYVSIIIEFLRGRPRMVFWCVTLTQAALWALLPSLFFSSPPGDVPMLLAIGHEFQLGSYLGPPLAFWLGEIAFRVGGSPGIYVLAQVCIVATYWAVFTLGRAIVGTRHAVLAVLLMIGIAAFAVPSPDFGPAILAAPFWALSLLWLWRAVGEGDRGSWFLLAVALGLLLLADYVGLILVALMIPVVLVSQRGRDALGDPEPWLAAALLVLLIVPHLAWLSYRYDLVLTELREGSTFAAALKSGLWLLGAIVFTHLGLFLLAGLASGWPRHRDSHAPEIDRNPVDGFARFYVYYFALMPAAVAIAIASASGRIGSLQRVAPLVVLSGLALIVFAGNRVLLYRERFVSSAWVGLLVVPPVLVVAGLVLLPWIFATNLKMSQPASTMGRFFADNFQRRTGRPLEYVTGDERFAPLIALGSPSRPHVYFDWAPQLSPWASPDDFQNRGGLLVWTATDNAGTPPAALKTQFPAMVAEVPRVFARVVQGVLPLTRLGWAVIRPAGTH
jgi:hypothetical protein